ncbi:diacylglycerol kinase [Altererythrobacter aurantiacus]|uniref:Diacylglycerol kinase n=1 Tax=Parapontixanthobacter aurantiacus TaxID=1463599 RepID=A0A844ZIY7_9SPHN|nr:diacylglycerol kinase family protein [Parapontixanthobacter aurantiacus]MXO86877.1 diacylglycerol kinase [Parapontixanthobacter aurantiacus]
MVNETSGSHQEELIAELRTMLGEGNADAVNVIDCKADGQPSRGDLERAGVDHFVVHGGDGSLNYATRELEGWGGALLALPGGTANLLCHRLYDECDSRDIVQRYMNGQFEPCRIRCVRGSSVFGLSEVLAGPGAKWADVREDLRDNDFTDAASEAAEAIAESWGGPKILLRDPACGKEDGYAGVRLSPMPSGIRIQGYTADTVGDFLGQGLAILKHNFRDGPHDDLEPVAAITCASEDDSPIPLMVDGERFEGKSRERFSLATLDLDLLCPLA